MIFRVVLIFNLVKWKRENIFLAFEVNACGKRSPRSRNEKQLKKLNTEWICLNFLYASDINLLSRRIISLNLPT